MTQPTREKPFELRDRWRDLERDLVTWALKFERFRETLLRDPAAVVEQEWGEPLPEGVSVRVLCESETSRVLVLPDRSIPPSDDLDRQTLGEPDDPHARLIARACRDEVFRRRLLTDPEAALAEALGVELPDDLEVTVVEESADVLHLVLPPALDESFATDGGLRDEDLALLSVPMVAGSPGNFGSFRAC